MVCIGENPVDNIEKTDYFKLTYNLCSDPLFIYF